VNTIAAAFLGEVLRASARYAEQGGDPSDGFVWLPGAREALVADFRAFELGSDNEVFSDSTFAVPMVYLHDWPDVTIHTNKDLPENLDATKLGRAAYLGAGIAWTLAALPNEEVPRLIALATADAERDLAAARLRDTLSAGSRDGRLAVREAALTGATTLRTVAQMWPASSGLAEQAASRMGAAAGEMPPAPPGVDARIPVRSRDVRGPLDVYYFDTLADRLPGEVAPTSVTSSPSLDALMRYEALNLVDGRRSVGEIRDVLAGRYGPSGLDRLGGWFDLLARARIVTWK
jgi:aminopeptidase YwaD